MLPCRETICKNSKKKQHTRKGRKKIDWSKAQNHIFEGFGVSYRQVLSCSSPDGATEKRSVALVWWCDTPRRFVFVRLFAIGMAGATHGVSHCQTSTIWVYRIVKHRQSRCVALSSKCSFSRPSIARVRWITSKRHPNYYITRIAINYPLIIAMRASLDAPNLWIINGNSCSKNTVSSE